MSVELGFEGLYSPLRDIGLDLGKLQCYVSSERYDADKEQKSD